MINHWFVSRPKRKLNPVPTILAALAKEALGQVWNAQRSTHLSFEEILEASGLKRAGQRRDHTGGGARTYFIWLASLGLLFKEAATGQVRLTLAGEAMLNGVSPTKIITNQILKFQFPSAYSTSRGVNVSPRFKIHPFWFLLKLLVDKRLQYLTQEEIAKIVLVEAENESDSCYEYIVNRILQFRDSGDRCLSANFAELYRSSRSKTNSAHEVFASLGDVANTMLNWLEYTHYVYREEGRVSVLDDIFITVEQLVSKQIDFIDKPLNHEYFQRRYGLDPEHKKDTRNLNNSSAVTYRMIVEQQVKQAFIDLSLKQPITKIDTNIIGAIAEQIGAQERLVETILQNNYPHGAIGGFMPAYFEMAFNGCEECRDFEITTAQIFHDIFGLDAKHLAGGAKEVPDVLLTCKSDGWQAIIDTKAYSNYDLGAAQRDRMIHHYIPDVRKYGSPTLPLGFFCYVSGGFKKTIEGPLHKIVTATGTNGSVITARNIIKLIERNQEKTVSHSELKSLLSSNKLVTESDICRLGYEYRPQELMCASPLEPYGRSIS